MKSKKIKAVSYSDRLRAYQAEKNGLYYTCKTQRELDAKIQLLIKKYGI